MYGKMNYPIKRKPAVEREIQRLRELLLVSGKNPEALKYIQEKLRKIGT